MFPEPRSARNPRSSTRTLHRCLYSSDSSTLEIVGLDELHVPTQPDLIVVATKHKEVAQAESADRGERAGGMPGAGYFRINRQPDPYRRGATVNAVAAGGRFLQHQRDECRAWGDRHRQSARQ